MTKASEFRATVQGTDGRKALLEKLNTLKKELSSLRIAQVTNGASSKLNQIRGVRKDIARVLTVLNQEASKQVRAKYAHLPNHKLPKDLRTKKTRAIRRRLTAENLRVKPTGQKGAVVKKTIPRMTAKETKKYYNTKNTPFAVLPESS